MQDPRRIDPALRRKYDVRGPRYTSYPPATHFHPIEEEELYKRWTAANDREKPSELSLYLHIPFCQTRCLFCGCHTHIVQDQSLVDRYVDTLLREMEITSRRIDPSRPVVQVALGGGTPNFLSEAQTERLLSGMAARWNIRPEAERSVEIDPRTATPGKIEVFLRHGFNRFSLGVQDFNPRVLSLVRRGQDLMSVEDLVSFLRRHGCRAINFDLIYGLPGQDLTGVAETARRVTCLRPSRIALYSYAHVPWIRPAQKALEGHGLPDPDLKLALFLEMLDHLQQEGYVAVGMDHFALPEDALVQALRNRTLRRNFMGYTTGRGTDLLALGESAISSIGTSYSQNCKEIIPYMEGIEQGRLPIERGFLLDCDDEIRRELILDLFCNFQADLIAFGRRFDIEAAAYLADDIAGLQPLIDDGLVSVTPQSIVVSETGRFFIRNICMKFDRYLERDAAARVYSRTV